MITYSKLGKMGRLGNQLFEIASTIGIAHTLNEPCVLPDWDYRPYFRIPDEFFTPRSAPVREAQNTELVNHMDPRCRDYLQDYNLFKEVEAKIWSWLQPSTLALDTLKSVNPFTDLPRPVLSVHVRRGDNVQDPGVQDKWRYHPLRPLSYYETAIEQLKGQFKSIVFFSDDPEWVRANFGHYEAQYDIQFFVGTPRVKEHQPEYRRQPFFDWVDLFLMSCADVHILSNSTYSWWGAFLSHDLVPIYPWPFFGVELQYIDASLLFPDGWQRLDHGQQYAA